MRTEYKTGNKAMKYGLWEQMTGHLALSHKGYSARVGTRNSRLQGMTKDDDNVMNSDQLIAPHSTEVQE